MRDSAYSKRFGPRSRSRSRSSYSKHFNQRSSDHDAKRSRKDAGRTEKQPKKNRVCVNNIPFECRWMELKDLFREKVGDVTFVMLFDDETGKFNGSGIIEFKDPETAQKAICIMNKYDYHGRQLIVKEGILVPLVEVLASE